MKSLEELISESIDLLADVRTLQQLIDISLGEGQDIGDESGAARMHLLIHCYQELVTPKIQQLDEMLASASKKIRAKA